MTSTTLKNVKHEIWDPSESRDKVIHARGEALLYPNMAAFAAKLQARSSLPLEFKFTSWEGMRGEEHFQLHVYSPDCPRSGANCSGSEVSTMIAVDTGRPRRYGNTALDGVILNRKKGQRRADPRANLDRVADNVILGLYIFGDHSKYIREPEAADMGLAA